MKRYFLAFIFLVVCLPRTLAQNEISQSLIIWGTGTKVNKLEWHPDGEMLAIATSDGLKLVDQNLFLIQSIHLGEAVRSFSWNPNGAEIALTNGTNIEIWRWENQQLEFYRTLERDQTQLNLLWSLDGGYLASMEGVSRDYDYWDGTLSFWQTTTWQLQSASTAIFNLIDGYAYVNQLAWNPDGSPTLSVAGNTIRFENGEAFVDKVATIFFIDARNGVIIKEFPLVVNTFTRALAWHPSGKLLAVGGSQGHFGLYDVNTGSYIEPLGIDNVDTDVIEWHPDGRYLADNYQIIDTLKHEALTELHYINRVGDAVDWHPDGRHIAAADHTGTITIEDIGLLAEFERVEASDE
jgi:WD40 repeat protein